MTLTRMIVLFAAALGLLFVVVVLRAETTRVHYEISLLDKQDDVLRQELRKEQLAMQRARNPAALLERVKDLRLTPAKEAPARPPARTTRP